VVSVSTAISDGIFRRCGPGRRLAAELLQPAVELVAFQGGNQGLPIGFRTQQLPWLITQVQVAADGGQFPRQRQLVQSGPQVLPNLAPDLVGVGDDLVEAAPVV
jgi:hypothetical protein